MYLFHFEAFTSPCELHIEAPTSSAADDAARAIVANAKRLEQQFSFFNPASEVYALNHRKRNSNIISDELSGLLTLALFYTEMTQGAFDIALSGTLKAASKALTLQEYQEKKRELISYASSSYISIQNHRLIFSNDFTKIDLGGLVKEYAVDQAVFHLRNIGITSALVNFGGDISAFGTCHDASWNIGIQDPDSSSVNLLEIQLDECALCTSGHSKRYTTIENEKITHIFGHPSGKEHSYRQVSVIAPTAVDAGIWSTALLANADIVLPGHIKVVHTI